VLTGAPNLEPLSLQRDVCLELAITNGALRAVHRLLLKTSRSYLPAVSGATGIAGYARASAEQLSGKAIARRWPMTSATLSPLPHLQMHSRVTRLGDTQHESQREVRTATNVSVLAADVLDLELDR
jgi:MarR family transcriptional regulator, organic hydroperoxide resistance regulator